MTPSTGQGIGFFATIVYNLTGFELVACMGSQIRNPRKDMAKSIFFASCLVIGLYVLGSIGILLAIPLNDLNLVSGITDVAQRIYSDHPMVVNIIILVFLSTIISDQVTWSMAPSRAAAEAANNGDLPSFIGKWNRFKTPYAANVVLGVTGTLVTLIYSYFASGNSSATFWSIFSFSSVCIIVSYLPYYSAFIKLRLTDKTTPREFKIPGGIVGAWLCTFLCLFFIVISITLFVFPNLLSLNFGWSHSLPIIIGMIIILGLSEIMIRYTEAKKARLGQ